MHIRRPSLAPLSALLSLLVLLACAAGARAAEHPPLGAYAQLPGAAGCVAAPGSEAGCTESAGMGEVWEVHASGDGRHVYAFTIGGAGHALVAFEDDRERGLRPVPGGCLNSTPREGCAHAPELLRTRALGLAPDGRHLYVVNEPDAGGSPAFLTSFARDPASGRLTRVPGADGCVTSGPGDAGCRHADGLRNATTLAFSPDGTSLYLASAASDGATGGLATLARDPASGRLAQPSPTACIVEAPVPPAGCVGGRALVGAASAAVSTDGRNVYVGGGTEAAGTIAVFARGAQGGLTQLAGTAGCVRGGAAPAGCAPARGMHGVFVESFPAPLAISPDDATVYKGGSVAAGGVAAFARHATTGELTQLPGRDGCLANGAPTADCGGATPLSQLWGMAASPDGSAVLAFSYRSMENRGAVTVLSRGGTGALTQRAAPFGCLSSWPDPGCLETRALDVPVNGAFSPDGARAYVAGAESRTIAVLAREAPPVCEDARVEATAGTAAALTLACREPNGQPLTRAVASWPAHGTLRELDAAAGTFSYTADAGFAGEDAIAFTASDGAHASTAATVTIAVTAPPPGRDPRDEPRPDPRRGPDPEPRTDPRTDPRPDPRSDPPVAQRLLLATRGAVRADARGRVRLRVRCAAAPGARCSGRLTLRTARKVSATPRARARVLTLGSARLAIPRGTTRTVTVRLTKPARALLGRTRRLPVLASVPGARSKLTLKAAARR